MASAKVDVYVKLPTGRNAVYYVSPSDTINRICTNIAEEEKVKPTQVRLKYQGKTLDNSHTMSYLGVRPETILKAEILVPRPVTLKLSLPNGLGDTELTSTSLDAISDVTERVAEIIKEDESKIVLKYSGRPVRGHTLLDAGLVDGSELTVEVAEPVPKDSPADEASSGASAKPMDKTKKQEILNSFASDGRPVEVVFSFDTTGSMYACLNQVRRNLKDCCTRLIQDIPNIRIGIIAHGDYCDANQYVIKVLDLTSDTQALVDFVTVVPSTGGGDSPECYEWVLRKAQGLDWSENSAKALVVIGDDLPHEPSYTDQQVFWRDEVDILAGMGIKVYGVQANPSTGYDRNRKQYFYEEMSEVTGGHYLLLDNFDVITDMFLAVCYRESQENGHDALGAFAREVEEAGRMTEERRQMFQQLEKPHKRQQEHSPQNQAQDAHGENRERAQRYVAEAWWDRSLSSGVSQPLYLYDATTDQWINAPHSTTYTVPSTPITSNAATRQRRKPKRKCTIM